MAAGYELIQDYRTLTPQAINGLAIPPAAYERMAGSLDDGEWNGVPSDNWDMVAAQFEATNHLHRKPTDISLDKLARFVTDELLRSGEGLGQQESFGEYTSLHFLPGLVLWCLAPALAKREPLWASFDDELHGWLQSWLGWLAIGSNGAPCQEMTAAETATIGPRVLKGNGGKSNTGMPMTAVNGLRGAVYYQGVRWIFAVEKSQNDLLGYFCLRPTERLGGKGYAWIQGIVDALVGKGYWRDPVTPDERAVMRSAVGGDLDALDQCVELCRRFKAPACLPWVRRYADNTVVFGIRRATSSSTMPVYATKVNPDGTCEVLIADPGHRDSRVHNWVRSGECVVDDAARTATAQRLDKSLPAITMRLPDQSVALVWSLDTMEDGSLVTWRHDRSGTGSPVPVPAPGPMPPPPPKVIMAPKRRKGSKKKLLWAAGALLIVGLLALRCFG